MDYDPWDDTEDWELEEHMEEYHLQNHVFKDRPIPRDLIMSIKQWSLQKFNTVMVGFFQAYEGDRDN